MNSITIRVPASIANLGPGFDVFSLALNEPADVAIASPADELTLSKISGLGIEKIPRDPDKNAVTIAAKRALKLIGKEEGLEVEIKKGIVPERGLGSSGASAVAGAIAANEIYGGNLSEKQLIEAAGYSEEKMTGSLHYDNVAASTLGSFVIISSVQPLEYIKFNPPPMKIVVAVPEEEAPTREGREILPESIPLHKAVANVGRSSSMIASLKDGDLESFGKYMVDNIVEPERVSKFPIVEEVKRAAHGAGAIGSAMAGAGPSVFAILDPESSPREIKKAMEDAYENGGLEAKSFDTIPGSGPKIKYGDDWIAR